MLRLPNTLDQLEMITLEDILDARSRFDGRVTTTPIMASAPFSEMSGRNVFLKAENMQRTGSFKIRGALNVLSRLEGQPVVAASAGNHAQGVALAASIAGSRCTVFMPNIAPIPKITATQDYGANVVLHGQSLAEAVEAAREFAASEGAHFVHPYDNSLTIAGQGTVGLEIIEQLPDVGTVVIPTGGGGLLAGTALAIHSTKPDVTMIGVEIGTCFGVRRESQTGRADSELSQGSANCCGWHRCHSPVRACLGYP